MGFTFLCSAIVAVIIGMSAGLAAEGEFSAVTVFRNGTEGYQVFRIPAVIKAVNGDLLAFCEARSGGDGSERD
ncbi:MAG: exo-alpha-sialidase, partial [Fuerstiella sp.]|nr:exo-alpha-sialidase [Fuerstiella sp.]